MSPPFDPHNPNPSDVTRSFAGWPKTANSQSETRVHQRESGGSTDPGLTTPTPLALPLPEKYLIRRALGRGAMGEVLHVYDTELRRDVALKYMRRHVATSPMACRRFLEEARILAQLDHPNVVRVFERGEIEGRPYFAMAYLGGATLSERRDEFRTSAARAVAVIAEVAAGVQHAHDHGVYHRDLKASNVVFDGPRPVVTDFGCARWDEGEMSTNGFALLGTPSHIAPEVWERGSKEHDARADLWALGVMLYQLLAGELPFAGDPLTPDGRSAILTADPAPIREGAKAVQGVDDRLEAIVGKALAKDPADRYPTVAAFAAELEAWLAAAPKADEPSAPKANRRRRWVASGVLVVGVVGATTAAAFWPKAEKGDPPPLPTPAITAKPSLAERLTNPGDSVTLIGETGLPTERCEELDGVAGVVRLADGVCEVEAVRVYLLELGNEPLPFPYRLRAEARVTSTTTDTKVGVYTSRRGHPQKDGTTVHTAFVNNFGPMDSAQKIPRFVKKDGWGAFPARVALTNTAFQPTDGAWGPIDKDAAAVGDDPGPFHPLTIDVLPTMWLSRRDSTEGPKKPRALAANATTAGLNAQGDVVTPPVFGDGFGLFVLQGGGQFRNVRITRLAD